MSTATPRTMQNHWLEETPLSLFLRFNQIRDFPRGQQRTFNLYIFFFVGDKLQLLLSPGQTKLSTPNSTIILSRDVDGEYHAAMQYQTLCLSDLVLAMIGPGITAKVLKNVQLLDFSFDGNSPGDLGRDGDQSVTIGVNVSLDPSENLQGRVVNISDVHAKPQTWTFTGQPLTYPQATQLLAQGQLSEDLTPLSIYGCFTMNDRCRKDTIVGGIEGDLHMYVKNALWTTLVSKLYERLGALEKDPLYLAIDLKDRLFYIFWQEQHDPTDYVQESSYIWDRMRSKRFEIIGLIRQKREELALRPGISRLVLESMLDEFGRVVVSWEKLNPSWYRGKLMELQASG